jgi:serine protease Do
MMKLDRFDRTDSHREYSTVQGPLVNMVRRSARLITNEICPLAITVSILITMPSLSTAVAQVRKQTPGSEVTRAILDRTVDPLQQLSTSLEALSKRVSPGVVQIFSTGYNLDRDHEPRTTDLLSRGKSVGSGIIIASDGWIVTNAHVVQGARRIRVRLSQDVPPSRSEDGTTRGALLEAKLVAADRDTDLALLKIDATELPALELSDSSDLKQGQLVLAFGSPLGLDNSVSMGVVSSVARQLDPDNPTIYVQTDAAINPGNSGGPLVDTGGHVVGITTRILTQSGGNEGIGLAIPSNVVRSVYKQVRSEGHVHHHGIGVFARDLTPALASGLGLDREGGVLIEDVVPQSPAETSGLMPGDVVLKVNGNPVQNIRQLALSLYSYAVGENATLEIRRDQQTRSYEVPVIEKQDLQGSLADLVAKEQNRIPELGIFALTLDEQLAPFLPGLRNRFGVVVAGKESEGAYLGESLMLGDIIYFVNGTRVHGVDSLRSTLDALKTADVIVLQVERLGSLRYVVLENDK